MAATAHQQKSVTPDTPITIKVALGDSGVRKLKLPLKDLGVGILPAKLRELLDIPAEHNVVFERFSDSAGGYVTLDPDNAAVFKTLIRAAKAKLKLRLKATVIPSVQPQQEQAVIEKITAVPTRESTALDRRSVGSGIFDFREAKQASEKSSFSTLVNKAAQTSDAYCARSSQFGCFHPTSPTSDLGMLLNATEHAYGSQWSVYCNECDKPMENVHFHCNICDGGDFDLCQDCVNSGKLCPGDGHWLIKRFIKDGKVTNSTTERISPRKSKESIATIVPAVENLPSPPSEFKSVPFAGIGTITGASRTCNNCIYILHEREFVTCQVCEDFDLCTKCHEKNAHGHSPAHAFAPATGETTLSATGKSLLAPGRNVRHQALCDACDQQIYGVRHKCQTCPDFDLCDACVKTASTSHPRHRFAALYVPIAENLTPSARHYGIYCDGPACNKKADQRYITGHRYKCAVCHDTDFCAACEASPHNTHNRTHPLILFKTPVRDAKITTQNEDTRGNVRLMGDRPQPSWPVTVSAPQPACSSLNLKTKVQVMADFMPTVPSPKSAASEIKPVEAPVESLPSASATGSSVVLNAHFVRDTISDGLKVLSGTSFTQVWTLRNPGPQPWPAGCSIHFVGGDNMLNVDNEHPASVSDIFTAAESNVCGRPVVVGEEVAFKVVLKAPTRKGRAISYWRLKAPNGMPFGHRLWCDIDVVMPELTAALPIRSLAGPAPQAPQAPMEVRAPYVFNLSPKSPITVATEKERKDAAKARVEYIKAKLQKAREERTKTMQAAMVAADALPKQDATLHTGAKLAEETAKSVSNNGDVQSESQTRNMVFPKLEKESPESSTYQSAPSSSGKARPAYVENEDGEVEDSALPTTPAHEASAIDTSDDLTDVEVLSATENHSDSDDDGFLTDEEYDILDASDRETIASP